MENKKDLLEKLKARLKSIEPIITKSFKTSEELKKYRDKNMGFYEEGKNLFEQIRQLEWELMTPEEKAKKLEVQQKIRAKIPYWRDKDKGDSK